MLSFPDPQWPRIRGCALAGACPGRCRVSPQDSIFSLLFLFSPQLCKLKRSQPLPRATWSVPSLQLSPHRSGRFHDSTKLFSKYTRKVISCLVFFFLFKKLNICRHHTNQKADHFAMDTEHRVGLGALGQASRGVGNMLSKASLREGRAVET